MSNPFRPRCAAGKACLGEKGLGKQVPLKANELRALVAAGDAAPQSQIVRASEDPRSAAWAPVAGRVYCGACAAAAGDPSEGACPAGKHTRESLLQAALRLDADAAAAAAERQYRV